jgi:hypothetical protein
VLVLDEAGAFAVAELDDAFEAPGLAFVLVVVELPGLRLASLMAGCWTC